MQKIMDAHCHIITPEYLEYIKDNNALLEDGFALPSWNENEHLQFMDKNNIQWSLLSVSSPHPYFGNDDECIGLTRKINEYCSDLKNKYPDRFGFCASLPLPNIKASIEEAIYALDVLKADGIKLASNSRGLYLGDPKLDPLFEELNKRNAVVIIHPHKPSAITEGLFSSGPIPLFEFLCDTTRAVMNMIANGVIIKYPNIKIVVPHCGSFLPNIVLRWSSLQPILLKNGLLKTAVDVNYNISKLYFDTAGTPAPSLLPLLLTIADPDKILYGTDYPFTPSIAVEKGFEKLLELFENNKDLTPYKDKILYENTKKLFNK